MKKEQIQEYAVRVTQANRSELVVIIFELIVACIHDAKEKWGQGDKAGYEQALRKGQSFLNELMGSLDYKYKISYELMSLYIYVNKTLAESIVKNETAKLESAESVISKLLTAYRGVAKQDNSNPIMDNTQQIYSGLTYGKGFLNETCIHPNESSRGFKA